VSSSSWSLDPLNLEKSNAHATNHPTKLQHFFLAHCIVEYAVPREVCGTKLTPSRD